MEPLVRQSLLAEHPDRPATVIAELVDSTGWTTRFRENERRCRPERRPVDPAEGLIWDHRAGIGRGRRHAEESARSPARWPPRWSDSCPTTGVEGLAERRTGFFATGVGWLNRVRPGRDQDVCFDSSTTPSTPTLIGPVPRRHRGPVPSRGPSRGTPGRGPSPGLGAWNAAHRPWHSLPRGCCAGPTNAAAPTPDPGEGQARNLVRDLPTTTAPSGSPPTSPTVRWA